MVISDRAGSRDAPVIAADAAHTQSTFTCRKYVEKEETFDCERLRGTSAQKNRGAGATGAAISLEAPGLAGVRLASAADGAGRRAILQCSRNVDLPQTAAAQERT